ncbi:hypothetical protein [Chlamydia vaughanii]|uniref:hypothetical protein n=1 Tax=Chlamydia vaughanii TaxID=3112552 RepID=UPI0032B2F9E1
MLSLSLQASESNISSSLKIPEPSSFARWKIIAGIFSVLLPSICIVLGALNLASSASGIVLIVGCVILGIVLLGMAVAAIYSCINKLRGLIPAIEKPSRSLQEEVLSYAEQLLERKRATTQPKDWGNVEPPLNEDISYLAQLRKEKFQEIQECLKYDSNNEFEYPKDAQTMETFTRLATEYLQISVAAAFLVTKELANYLAMHPEVLYTELFTRPESCYSEIFYYPSTAYFLLRFLYLDCKDEVSETTKKSRIALFYKEKTLESSCRELYNDFCDHISLYVGTEERESDDDTISLVGHSTPDISREFEEIFQQ